LIAHLFLSDHHLNSPCAVTKIKEANLAHFSHAQNTTRSPDDGLTRWVPNNWQCANRFHGHGIIKSAAPRINTQLLDAAQFGAAIGFKFVWRTQGNGFPEKRFAMFQFLVNTARRLHLTGGHAEKTSATLKPKSIKVARPPESSTRSKEDRFDPTDGPQKESRRGAMIF
jgi:hypothetical protein